MVSSIVVYGWQLHTESCHEDRPRARGFGPYGRTKRASEELALEYHTSGRLPVSVVRPGNVYGPGSVNWVDSLVAILRARRGILIDRGEGDASLAYVDNVVDVIVRALATESAAGRVYNAIDGSGVTWRRYMSDIAVIAGAPAPVRSIPWQVAMVLATAMETAGRITRRDKRPLLTREAVALLASRKPIPIDRARSELGYDVPVSYEQAMEYVAQYVHGELI